MKPVSYPKRRTQSLKVRADVSTYIIWRGGAPHLPGTNQPCMQPTNGTSCPPPAGWEERPLVVLPPLAQESGVAARRPEPRYGTRLGCFFGGLVCGGKAWLFFPFAVVGQLAPPTKNPLRHFRQALSRGTSLHGRAAHLLSAQRGAERRKTSNERRAPVLSSQPAAFSHRCRDRSCASPHSSPPPHPRRPSIATRNKSTPMY